jgi:hypothetical protein
MDEAHSIHSSEDKRINEFYRRDALQDLGVNGRIYLFREPCLSELVYERLNFGPVLYPYCH